MYGEDVVRMIGELIAENQESLDEVLVDPIDDELVDLMDDELIDPIVGDGVFGPTSDKRGPKRCFRKARGHSGSK